MSDQESVSRLGKVIDLLRERGGALNIEDIAKQLHLPVAKVRNVITPYQAKVVKVGVKVFDLATRVYRGRVFRYTPTQEDVAHGGIHYNSDIAFLLSGYQGEYTDLIHIRSELGDFDLKRGASVHHDYLTGCKNWYAKSPYQPGDDMLFTCQDLETKTYSLQLEPQNQRDEAQITQKNAQLADFIYQLLLFEPRHYADTLFLIRKYAFEFAGFAKPAPDMLLRTIENDLRFIHNQRDQVCTYDGVPLYAEQNIKESVVIGVRKYYLESRDHQYYPVSIQHNDEFNLKEAWCTHCYRRASWKADHWVHVYSIDNVFDIEVGRDFYLFDSRDTIRSKKKEKAMSVTRKPKSLPITLTDLEYIEGSDWNFFLSEIISNVWCSKCKTTVSITGYSAELNDLDDIILHGSCSDCHGPVARYIETGEVHTCLPRIAKVRQTHASG